MEHMIMAAPPTPLYAQLDRVYLIQATLKTFKGRRDVVVHLFRHDTDPTEMESLRDLDIVGKADVNTPEGATEENALRSLLEAFTAEEGNALLEYLKQRYEEHVIRVTVCPVDLPVPMGMVPFSGIPEGKSMGFIRFDAAAAYNLPFGVHGFYDLDAHEPLVGE